MHHDLTVYLLVHFNHPQFQVVVINHLFTGIFNPLIQACSHRGVVGPHLTRINVPPQIFSTALKIQGESSGIGGTNDTFWSLGGLFRASRKELSIVFRSVKGVLSNTSRDRCWYQLVQ